MNNMLNSNLINDFSKLNTNDWINVDNKTFFITGATGLIGSTLVKYLLYISNTVKIIALVRDEEKAKKLFNSDQIKYYLGNIESKQQINESIDFIVHCANPTSSKFFIYYPVETIKTAVCGTINMLEFAKLKNVKSFVFLSTMEVHGTPIQGHKVQVEEGGSFDTQIVRNSYPLSKQVCESLCISYATEYGVDAKVLRLTQTFGPGVSYDDKRVFAEFARCAVERKDIILKTKGETERSYLYTVDAVEAILTVLIKGLKGNIYTAANENTYCSILEMANLIANKYGIKVLIDQQDTSKYGYANTLHMDLDTGKLKKLGWVPKTGLEEAFNRMIEDWRDIGNE